MAKTIEEFLEASALRKHTVNDLKIEPIDLYEMSMLDRVGVIEEHGRIHKILRDYEIAKEDALAEGTEFNEEDPSEQLAILMAKTVLRSMFGFDKEYSEEQCRMLCRKYSDAVLTELFNRVLNFRDLDESSINSAKKS